MKIAIIVPRYGLVGGAETFVFELTERLAQLDDYEVHVLANRWRKGNASITFHKIPIIPFPRWLRPVSFASFAQKAIRAASFDIIHSHDRIFEMNLLTFHGIPHETWIKKTKRNHLSLFDKATAWVEKKGIYSAPSPTILPVSNLVKEELLNLYPLSESRIYVVHPGVSIDRFSKLDAAACRKEIRMRHGISQSDVVVLFVGMNFEIKRLELVMKGVAGLVGKGGKKVNLLVVGKGEVGLYMTMARDLGIHRRVFFTGVTKEVEKYYLASDIFAMPSLYDTFGLVVLEAMAAGLPVIISRRVGARDIIDPGINGLILPHSPSSADITNTLSLLLDDQKRKKMGEQARQVALQHDWSNVTQQVAQFYRNIKKTRPR
ncbi:MAG: glycosyltransferase family 4 protein [Pseudomonadota bacterium]